MIIAIANQSEDGGRSVLANNLALLRAASGRKVLLVDTDPVQPSVSWSAARSAAGLGPRIPARALRGSGVQPELEALEPSYQDIVIDTEGRDSAESRDALMAAKLVLVPVKTDQVDLASQYLLIARLNVARMFNPGLRVLFVIVGGPGEPTAPELAAVRTYVAHVMSANLAATVLHVDARAGAEMQALYREVFIN